MDYSGWPLIMIVCGTLNLFEGYSSWVYDCNRRMDLSARQQNTRCIDDLITPASKRSTKYQNLMKKLSTALNSRLKQGRPPKYYRMCHRELRKLIGRQL